MNQNLLGSILGRSSIKIGHLVPRCFPPSFGSFGQAISEEKILKIGQPETRIAYLLGSILGRSSIKIGHIVPIR
jgi:hypothetical protein